MSLRQPLRRPARLLRPRIDLHHPHRLPAFLRHDPARRHAVCSPLLQIGAQREPRRGQRVDASQIGLSLPGRRRAAAGAALIVHSFVCQSPKSRLLGKKRANCKEGRIAAPLFPCPAMPCHTKPSRAMPRHAKPCPDEPGLAVVSPPSPALPRQAVPRPRPHARTLQPPRKTLP